MIIPAFVTSELKEAFLAVVNTQPQDERVIAKNAERVVTARLRDAKFFWESDRGALLESRTTTFCSNGFRPSADAVIGSPRGKGYRGLPAYHPIGVRNLH